MGYYFVYLAMLSDVKNEMRTSLNSGEKDEDIQVLKFDYSSGQVTDKDFELVEDDEFKYKGEMYDVEEAVIKDGFIYYYCVNDTKEDELNSSLSQYIVNNLTSNPDHQKKAVELIKKILDKYIPSEEQFCGNATPPIEKSFVIYSNSQSSNFTSPLTPPPKPARLNLV
jgi:hypothetical protein